MRVLKDDTHALEEVRRSATYGRREAHIQAHASRNRNRPLPKLQLKQIEDVGCPMRSG
jgi:hypothetical protein